MKLFQWVHRKLGQNSIDPFKDFTLVQPTLDNQSTQTKASFSSISQLGFLKPHHQESHTYYSGFNDNREEDKSQETPAIISELFEGFLTIGTLGAETVTNEPATPTFSMPLENLTMRDAKVTENELKHISYELEKFLEAEKERFYESSGRNSHVSNITLGGKQTDGSEAEDFGSKTVCPLQGYLLGSSSELQEKTEVRKERASLAELFHKTKTTNGDCMDTGVRETQVKQAHKSAMHIMKKLLKMVRSSSKSYNNSRNDVDSDTTHTKLPKVPRMFHRKVHPENTINAKDITKSHKGKIKHLPRGRRFHSDSKSRKWSQHSKTNWNPPQDGLSCSGSTGNNEHWIKTDTEYVVLEL